jgi:hypothetical protein
MKKIFSLVIATVLLTSAFSQNTTQIAKSFIMERQSSFNQKQEPIQVKNIEETLKKVKGLKVSYSHTTFTVSMDSASVKDIIIVNSQTIINNRKKPFIYFSVSKINGLYLIEEITGTDAL